MRFLVKVRLPLGSRKPLAEDAEFRKALDHVLDGNKVEALFFGEEHGKHCLFLVLNARDAHQVVGLTGPLRQNLKAQVEFLPATAPGTVRAPESQRAVS